MDRVDNSCFTHLLNLPKDSIKYLRVLCSLLLANRRVIRFERNLML